MIRKALIVLYLATPLPCLAQGTPAQMSPANDTGVRPYTPYVTARENVNLANGNLNLVIPLLNLPGRNGLNLNLAIEYDSKIWKLQTYYDPVADFMRGTWTKADFDSLQGQFGPGWRLNIPTLTTDGAVTDPSTGYCDGSQVVRLEDGGKYLFHNRNPCPASFRIALMDSEDSTGMQLDNSNPSDAVLILRNGTRYHFGTGSLTKIVDANGNSITYSTDPQSGLLYITDTVGRRVTLNSGPSGTLTGITYKGNNGTDQTIQFTFNGSTVQQYTFYYPLDCIRCSPSFQVTNRSFGPFAMTGLFDGITFPDGQHYSFSYNSFLELSKITYPSGGYTAYDFPLDFTVDRHLNYRLGEFIMDLPADFREVRKRRVCRNASGSCTAAQEDLTTFIAGVNDTVPNNNYMDVLDANGQLSRHQFSQGSIAGYPSEDFNHGLSPHETTVYSYAGQTTTSPLLRTVQTSYEGNYAWSLPTQITTSLNDVTPAITKSENFTYDPYSVWYLQFPTSLNPSPAPAVRVRSIDNVKTHLQYDFNGALLRRTENTWVKTNPANNLNYFDTSIRMLSLKAEEQVFNTVSGGTPLSDTKYEYDNYSGSNPLVTTTAIQHESPPQPLARGNLTAVSRWRNTDLAWLPTVKQFDDSGNVVKITDPRNNPTTFSYMDSFTPACPPTGATFAYKTRITNAVSQNTNFKYNACDGTLASITDPNVQTISNIYDNSSHLTQISLPDGGQTTYNYNGFLVPFTFGSRRKRDVGSPGTDIVSTTIYDGLARTSQTQLNSDPDCPSGDKTDTTYDALGRVFTVSNPYCTTGDAAYGLTTYTYDSLGRTKQVTKPDNSTVLTTYTGRAMQVQDEGNGNGTQRITRISQIDGLGRLASVCEVTSATLIGSGGTPVACGQDIAATGFLTSYQYDALDNLTSVSTSGLNPRTFAYDSLSRLTSATNPESAQTCYGTMSAGVCQANGYDANGNLLTKTDARGITTTYSYDALNRLTGKTYSDVTPAATFNYDQSSALGVTLTNTIGRKSSQSTTGPNATGSVFSYDTMGRISNNSQCTPQNCGTGVFAFQYTQYDFVGDLVSATNAVGVTFSYTYNTVARLTGITTNFIDSSHPGTLFSNAHYSPFGALTSATLGNSVNESWGYNNRLWQQSRTTTFGTTTRYSFNVATFAPNGDILAANDSANGNWVYKYDDFNRLTCSNLASNGTCATPTSGTPTYSYDYDRFGNRWHQNGPQSSQLGFDANNRIMGVTGVGYDAAGNLTSDGSGPGSHTYFYDAENRIVQVDGTLGTCSTATACYVYNADGQRARKTTGGSSMDYLYDLSGHKVADVAPAGVFMQGELYAGNRHFAIYAPAPGPTGATFFTHSDWLGTERVRTDMTGTNCESIGSLPFGDGQSITGTCGDVSPMHFTGKERDSESGLDNFGARYMGSSLGRFMSPDWSASPEPVPYAKLDDPQSLNLYAYVGNNPLSRVDADGHYELNASGCGDNAKCQKKWDKAAKKFEARREKNLHSKKAAVRAAAANYGTLGEANGVHVGFANLASQNIYGSVDPRGSIAGQKLVQVTLDFGRAGNSETITHEGTHVGDDMRFLNSFNPLTGGYDQTLNITHGQTEFNAFRAGAEISREHGFGPNDTQKIWNFLHSTPAYENILNVPVFDPSRFPAAAPPQPLPPQGVPDDEND